MPAKAAPFRSRNLRQRLLELPAAKRYVVGYSGGADSTALLVALARQRENLGARIEAIHFNHGLNEDSESWQQHCEAFCLQLGIPITSHTLDLSPGMTDLENRARKLRYQWVEEHIDRETIYLTAHNADDRAETFLLNALRGSGLEGLASIPEIRPLGPGQVARPLLGFSHAALTAYLEQKGFRWIEDPSNQDSGPDRNFIRNEVMPLLESRWPAARQTLARTSGHLRSANEVLRDLLTQQCDFASLDDNKLPLRVLHMLGPAASSYVLREWLRRQDAPAVPEARLEEFLQQLAESTPESQCEMTWAGWALRLYRHELRLLASIDFPECPRRDWSDNSQLDLGPGLGKLVFHGDVPKQGHQWVVGPRQAGSRIQLHAGGPGRKLKKMLSEQPVPPWQRMSIPILYQNGQALAIGDWQLAPEFAEWLAEQGLEYRWQPELAELCDTQASCHEFVRRKQLA